MGKKTKEVESNVPQLGRPGNKVKIGIVGLPNVGKSTTFNCLTNQNVDAENFPFCTIEPNEAVVVVPDQRFDNLVEIFKPKSEVPAVLHVTDIAGLVKGASEGKGLGNAFLSNIQAVDAIYHVCRAFSDKKIEHVEGDVNPVRDFDIIRGELMKKDAEWVSGELSRLSKNCKNGDAAAKKLNDKLVKTCEQILAGFEADKPLDVRHHDWDPVQIQFLNKLQLLTAKPVVYLVNVSKQNFLKNQNKFFKNIVKWVKEFAKGDKVIIYSAKFEQDYMNADEEGKAAMAKEAGKGSVLPKIIVTGYHALGLQHFFTCGADEVRAWTVKQNQKAPQAAGVIHGDFEKTFVKAEVYQYKDLEEYKTEQGVKNAGKYMSRGKEYIVKDGDIIFFKTGAGKKK